MTTPIIQFARTADPLEIAFSVTGQGPPLVFCDGPFQPLRSGPSQRLADQLAESFQVVRFDHRGTGASQREALPDGLDSQVLDLEAVVNQLALDRFTLCGFSHGAHAALAFSARHPERVDHLIIYGSPGPHQTPRSPEQVTYDEAFDRLLEQALTRDNLFARRAFAMALMPAAPLDELDSFASDFAEHITAEVMLAYNAASRASTIELLTPNITAPTLVTHVAADPLEEAAGGQRIAALIPGAHFATLPGTDHVLRPGQPAADTFISHLLEFVGTPPPSPASDRRRSTPPVDLTPRELEVITLLASGDSNQEIARTLELSVRTIERHLANLYVKIDARGRADAIAYAYQHGLTNSGA